MQIKHIFFLSIIFINFNIFALPDGDGTSENEFEIYKAQKREAKQDILVSEIYEQENFSYELERGLTKAIIHQLIRILLRDQEFIAYTFWGESRTEQRAEKLNLVFDQLGVSFEGNISELQLNLAAYRILRRVRHNYLDLILKKYSDIDFLQDRVHGSKYTITLFQVHMLVEVLLNGEQSIDYNLWAGKSTVNRMADAVRETNIRLKNIDQRFIFDSQYNGLFKELAEHIVFNAHEIDQKLKLEKFADEPGTKRRALKQKKVGNIIDFKTAFDKAKR